MILLNSCLSLQNDFNPLNVNYLSSIFVHKVFVPGSEYLGCQFAANALLEICFCYLYFVCKAKNVKNLLVTFIANSAKQSCYRKFFLSVNICIHDIVDVSCKLYPRSLKRDDTGRVEFSSIGMETLSKENAR